MPDDEIGPMASWPTGRLLSTAARLVEREWAEALTRLGLTHAGLIVLHLLDDGPLSQADLARRARVEAQTMSRTVERLAREGHVTRARSATDARRRMVARTASGEAVWHRAQSIESEVFPPIGDPEAIRRLLLEIIAGGSGGRF